MFGSRTGDRDNRKPKKPGFDGVRMNEQITEREVRLLGREGEQLGVMSLADAFKIVNDIIRNEDIELDLVEISSNTRPIVCKIMNYRKFLYEKGKKEKESKKNSKVVKLKELTIKPAIEKNDLDHKCRQARGFLMDGDKVKVSLRSRGREMQHLQENMEILKKFVSQLEDVSVVEQAIKQERNIASVILKSNIKDKPLKNNEEEQCQK